MEHHAEEAALRLELVAMLQQASVARGRGGPSSATTRATSRGLTFDPRTKWVLIVEDDEDARVSLEDVLKTVGYQVTTACDGAQALDILYAAWWQPGPMGRPQERVPDLLLLDLMLPVLSGTRLWHVLYSNPNFRPLAEIHTVAISGDPDLKNQSWAISLAKPFDIDALLRTVAGAVR